APAARLLHPTVAGLKLALRVIDVSIGGCALFLPDDVPPIEPGTLLERVSIDLDADTRFQVNLRLRHITSINGEARGAHLGLEMVCASGDVLRSLQRFIDQTQKRAKLLTLD
ncbi:MAG: PilZ domain-containing protein, partial [Pseudomonadota bacterium]|nr:PilZ domain-containing protein [Pseudomonadota bacterium]